MSDPALTLLKYVFLIILYLFFLRVLRAVWVEMREPRPAPLPAGAAADVAPAGLASAAAGAAAGAPTVAPGSAPLSSAGPEHLVGVAPEEARGLDFALPNEATVGRAPGCAILLTGDSFVSQLHARVFRRDGQVWVEDLGSTNGTFLNGKPVGSPVAVRRGDKVQFGRTTMELRTR